MGQRRQDNSLLPTQILKQFPPTRRYLIGVSGGRDSVALLHSLVSRGYRKLIVCHLNHQLRGSAARADAQFVRRMAQDQNLEFELGSADVGAKARRTKQSIETAGRTARYDFFADIARHRRCRTLFLGHHADDLVETFLMNLFRGAGPAGLAGMRKITSRKIAGVELEIVRPLLGVWREEIDAYVRQHQLDFRRDATNESLEPTRNRFRRRIIPYLEKQFGRKVRASIWRAATIAADEEKWISELVEATGFGTDQLAADKLRAEAPALQRRVLHQWLRRSGIEGLDFEVIERVRGLLDPETGAARTNLPRDRHVRRRARKLFIEEKPARRRAKT
jgi:tRNA(Ile)-lysidine synthase